MLRYLVFASLPFLVRGQFYFCTPLSNETWAGLVEAISESYRLAVLCPFKISGDGCPSIDEYPEGLVLGHGSDDVMIIECDPDFNVPFQEGKTKSRCIIDCPGRHFSVGPSSRGLILTNMILSGATNSSIYVEENGRLDVVNVLFENNSALNNNAGAIEIRYGSTISVEFCTFENNNGVVGGAIHAEGSMVNVKQSSFYGNQAIAGGGAMAVDAESVVEITHSSFLDNEAPHGGAVYMAELTEISISQSRFENNLGSLYGGAIFTEGILTVDESTFQDNFGIEGGGAINCGIGATTILQSNTFINNGSGGFGPAVYDRYNSGVVKQGNTGCGQRVDTDGFSPVTWNIQCNGVYLLVGLLKTGRCLPFQHQCGTPTGLPSTYPVTIRSIPPSSLPSFKPSKENTSWPLQPSAMPTISQSDYPSLHPSYAVSSVPSANVSPVAVSLDEPSLIPSDAPSVIPSDVPSLAPSVEPSMLSWRGS